jgi:hypothetical protein
VSCIHFARIISIPKLILATVTGNIERTVPRSALGRGGGGCAGRMNNEPLRQLPQTAVSEQNGYGAVLYHTETIKTHANVNIVTQLYNGSYVPRTIPKLRYNTLNS